MWSLYYNEKNIKVYIHSFRSFPKSNQTHFSGRHLVSQVVKKQYKDNQEKLFIVLNPLVSLHESVSKYR